MATQSNQDTYPYDTQNPMELNRYVYAINNPIRYMDASGMNSEQSLIAKIQIAAKKGFQYFTNTMKDDFWAGFTGGVAGWVMGKFILHSIKFGLSLLNEKNSRDPVFSDNWRTNIYNMVDLLVAGFVGGLIELSNVRVANYSIPFLRIDKIVASIAGGYNSRGLELLEKSFEGYPKGTKSFVITTMGILSDGLIDASSELFDELTGE